MIYKRHPRPAASQQGIVLLETLIAILIFSIGLLGAVGLQAVMLKGAADAKHRAEAGYLVKKRIGEIWLAGPNKIPEYVEGGTDISASSGLPSGARITTAGVAGAVGDACASDPTCVTVTVTWQQPGDLQSHNVTTVARITP